MTQTIAMTRLIQSAAPEVYTLSRTAGPRIGRELGDRRCVLLVGKDAGQGAEHAGFLQSLGYTVIERKTFAINTADLADQAAGWSAVVLDADSIGSDMASGALRRLRRVAPHVPVIVMTSSVEESDFSAIGSDLPDVTLCKPLSFHHLELGIQMVTEGR